MMTGKQDEEGSAMRRVAASVRMVKTKEGGDQGGKTGEVADVQFSKRGKETPPDSYPGCPKHPAAWL